MYRILHSSHTNSAVCDEIERSATRNGFEGKRQSGAPLTRKISTTPICGRCNTTIEDLSTPSEIAGTQLFFGVNVHHDFKDQHAIDTMLNEAILSSVHWCCSKIRRIKFNVDGSYSLQDQAIKGGGVIRYHDDLWLFGFTRNFGTRSSI
ncbi:hypothetical protein Lal_00018638 [Lupinus albus]|nr:hypothetical protein Lal_00018638 [Lupinus albus]